MHSLCDPSSSQNVVMGANEAKSSHSPLVSLKTSPYHNAVFRYRTSKKFLRVLDLSGSGLVDQLSRLSLNSFSDRFTRRAVGA